MLRIINRVLVPSFLHSVCILFLLGHNFGVVATELVRKLPLQVKIDAKTKKTVYSGLQ